MVLTPTDANNLASEAQVIFTEFSCDSQLIASLLYLTYLDFVLAHLILPFIAA